MKRPVARALTRLYVPSWQRRYGSEFEALLVELPCTCALLADVVPRALATRKRAAAVLAALLLLLSAAGSQLARPHPPSQVAERVEQRGTALAPCRSYSSASQNEIITRRQCLD